MVLSFTSIVSLTITDNLASQKVVIKTGIYYPQSIWGAGDLPLGSGKRLDLLIRTELVMTVDAADSVHILEV